MAARPPGGRGPGRGERVASADSGSVSLCVLHHFGGAGSPLRLSWHFVAALRCSMLLARSLGREFCKFFIPGSPQKQAFSLRGSSFFSFSDFVLRNSSWGLLGVILARLEGLLGSFGVPSGGLLGFLGCHLSALGGLLGGCLGASSRQLLPRSPQKTSKSPRRSPQEAPKGLK